MDSLLRQVPYLLVSRGSILLALLFVGLIGEYVGAIYAQVKSRPLVIEQERVNFDEPPRPDPVPK